MPKRLYSTGSSAVMMLVSPLLIFDSAEYSVVVLPEPVGPVTRTMPYGFEIASISSRSARGSIPNFSRSRVRLPLSRIRSTTFSPNSVGSTLTRKSMTFLPTFSLMRPSCGTRRSAMFSDAMILNREIRAERILRGGFMTSANAPSIRYRTRNSCSKHSK